MARHLHVDNGILSWQGRELSLDFGIDIDKYGNTAIGFDPVLSSSSDSWHDQWRLWYDLHRGKNRKVPFFRLSGETEDGIKVWTDYAYLKGLGQSSTPQEIRLQPEGVAAELNLEYPVPESVLLSEEIYTTYLSRGQLGFAHAPIQTPLGELTTAATAKTEESLDRFGAIAIKKTVSAGITEWLNDCDDLAERILNILSLAQGRWLQWTSREVAAGDQFISQRIRPRELRATALAHTFHHLNLRPILESAVKSYTQDLVERTGLDAALSWMLAPASYVEGTFLNQLIALEQLVSFFDAQVRGVIPREDFQSVVKPKLSQVITELVDANELPSERGEIFIAKIKGLNSPVFFDKVRRLIAHYGVPVDDLENDLKFVVVDCRNDLVHRGLLRKIGDDSDHIHRNSDIAEELLKRIVMAMLGYQGQYISPLYNLNTYIFKDGKVEPLYRRESD